MSSPAPWWQAVGYGMTGRVIPVDQSQDQAPQAALIAAWLGRHGVDASAIAAERTRCLSARQPWPHPLPEEVRTGIGTAQWAALVDEVRALTTGRSIPVVQRPRPGTMSPHDHRLIADKPPHHG